MVFFPNEEMSCKAGLAFEIRKRSKIESSWWSDQVVHGGNDVRRGREREEEDKKQGTVRRKFLVYVPVKRHLTLAQTERTKKIL